MSFRLKVAVVKGFVIFHLHMGCVLFKRGRLGESPLHYVAWLPVMLLLFNISDFIIEMFVQNLAQDVV